MMYQHCPSVLAVVYYSGMVGRVAMHHHGAGRRCRAAISGSSSNHTATTYYRDYRTKQAILIVCTYKLVLVATVVPTAVSKY